MWFADHEPLGLRLSNMRFSEFNNYIIKRENSARFMTLFKRKCRDYFKIPWAAIIMTPIAAMKPTSVVTV